MKPRPPHQVEQQGFQVVVGAVGGGDASTAHGVRRPPQEFIAHLAGGLLHPQAPGPGLMGHVARANDAGDVLPGAPLRHKGGVPVGFGPAQVVVVVGGRHPEAPLSGPGVEQVKQAHGIRTAGHGAQHRAPPGEHVVFGCQGFDGFQHKVSFAAGGCGHPPLRRGRCLHRPIPRQYSMCLRSMDEKVVYSGSHWSSTVRVSPWRFLAMMHSARLWFSSLSL
ncbi:Uncharacterised protein [Flavonifractor plautii]|uniref:Uncharacterized protein n=1 Tax=Flavonifractor plautii TaxID=292800 RepID=A0A174FAU9_FLAPL|nr:Uncharacterised protein [Flavonifractor plautii]